LHTVSIANAMKANDGIKAWLTVDGGLRITKTDGNEEIAVIVYPVYDKNGYVIGYALHSDSDAYTKFAVARNPDDAAARILNALYIDMIL
jgi:hypothetical protein